jgi:hypothetical protein
VSVLVGGIAGAASRLGGGLTSVGALRVADVPPTAQQRVRPSLGPTAGRFRRHITGVTTDYFNVPLGGCTVSVMDVAGNVEVAEVTSDANGVYDVPVYAGDLLYFAYARKATVPPVFGATDHFTAA